MMSRFRPFLFLSLVGLVLLSGPEAQAASKAPEIGTQGQSKAAQAQAMMVLHKQLSASPRATVRHSVVLTAGSGADISDVFDVTLTDSLSLGLVYEGNPTVSIGGGVGADNTIGAPDITGDGTTTPQTLEWSFNFGNADIDTLSPLEALNLLARMKKYKIQSTGGKET